MFGRPASTLTSSACSAAAVDCTRPVSRSRRQTPDHGQLCKLPTTVHLPPLGGGDCLNGQTAELPSIKSERSDSKADRKDTKATLPAMTLSVTAALIHEQENFYERRYHSLTNTFVHIRQCKARASKRSKSWSGCFGTRSAVLQICPSTENASDVRHRSNSGECRSSIITDASSRPKQQEVELEGLPCLLLSSSLGRLCPAASNGSIIKPLSLVRDSDFKDPDVSQATTRGWEPPTILSLALSCGCTPSSKASTRSPDDLSDVLSEVGLGARSEEAGWYGGEFVPQISMFSSSPVYQDQIRADSGNLSVKQLCEQSATFPRSSRSSSDGSVCASPAGNPHAEGASVVGSEVNRSPNRQCISTLMIRNLPSATTQADLLKELDKYGFAGKYDFVYLPRSINVSLGFAFVNFIDPCNAAVLIANWHRRFVFGRHGKAALNISASEIQGLEANVAKWMTARQRRSKDAQRRPFVLGLGSD